MWNSVLPSMMFSQVFLILSCFLYYSILLSMPHLALLTFNDSFSKLPPIKYAVNVERKEVHQVPINFIVYILGN